ncbi:MAG: ABC transporter permease [Maricaulis sp.]|nr:ABC transporter permease [Maricaulis sp.]HAQ34582.1 ABC transporter permease [Alphaproteobacteria bacterium]
MNEATLVRKGLTRKRLRAILMIVSISIAFFIFGMLGAVNYAFGAGTRVAEANRLVTVNAINFTVSMPSAYYGRVQQVDGITAVTHANWFGGYYQQPANFVQTFAIEPESYLQVYPELTMPADQREAFINTRTCLLVGRAIADQYGWSVGDRIPLNSNIWQQSDGTSDWDFDICAIFSAEDASVPTNYVMFHYEYFNESVAFARDTIGWMILLTEDVALNDQVANEIDTMFANSPAETETTTEAAFGEAFLDQIGNINLIMTSVIGAAFATILMIVGTTLILSINERTKEIAVLKTLGFNSGRIFRMILLESFLLSFLGAFLGLAMAWGVVALMAGALDSFLPGFALPWLIIAQGAALALVFALLTGLFPAYNAMRIKIVDAFGKL